MAGSISLSNKRWGVPKLKMLELFKNEQLLGQRDQKGDHSSKKECSLTLTCPWPYTLCSPGFMFLTALQISGQANLCPEDPVRVDSSTVSVLEIQEPQTPSSILFWFHLIWQLSSETKKQNSKKGGCGRHWCFSLIFPTLLLWAWLRLPFPAFLMLDRACGLLWPMTRKWKWCVCLPGGSL